MSLEYLLDTNFLLKPLRRRPARRVLEWIEEHRWEAATAAPVWHEYGSVAGGCLRRRGTRSSVGAAVTAGA